MSKRDGTVTVFRVCSNWQDILCQIKVMCREGVLMMLVLHPQLMMMNSSQFNSSLQSCNLWKSPVSLCVGRMQHQFQQRLLSNFCSQRFDRFVLASGFFSVLVGSWKFQGNIEIWYCFLGMECPGKTKTLTVCDNWTRNRAHDTIKCIQLIKESSVLSYLLINMLSKTLAWTRMSHILYNKNM